MGRSNNSVDFVTCPCGKRGYRSRKEARRASRIRSISGVNAYRCAHPNAHPIFFWHLGHLPTATKDGRRERGSLGTHATRSPGTFKGVERSPLPRQDTL